MYKLTHLNCDKTKQKNSVTKLKTNIVNTLKNSDLPKIKKIKQIVKKILQTLMVKKIKKNKKYNFPKLKTPNVKKSYINSNGFPIHCLNLLVLGKHIFFFKSLYF